MSIPITGYILIALLVSVSALQVTPKHQYHQYLYYSQYSTNFYGGSSGNYFSDKISDFQDNLKYIAVRYGSRIDMIQFCFSWQGCLPSHGGDGGNYEEYHLPSGQYVKQIEYRSGEQLDAIRFTTNTGKKSKFFGGTGGGYKTDIYPDGYRIVGYFGRSGSRVDQLGILLAKGMYQ